MVSDGHEPNNSADAATALGLGGITGALCNIQTGLPQDIDFYTVTVPSGKQLDVTLNNLPADYNLYVQRAGQTLATSLNSGLTDETIALPNYDSDGVYAIAVFSPSPVNNATAYSLNVGLSDAPPQTVFSDAQCLNVDPNDPAGAAGNFKQSQATPLTVNAPTTGALCYQEDTDFYSFNGTTGQTLSVDLPVRPADYQIYVYRPDGSFFNAFSATGTWTYNMPFTLDTSGTWAVAVLDATLTPTLSQYQLQVSDLSCAVNDPHEPNNQAGQAADISGQSRVFATLCSGSDLDYYQFNTSAGQTLTLNYPAGGAGGTLILQNSAGATLGQVAPGGQGVFTLADAGTYRLLAAKSDLSGSDVPYMFQWLLDTPQPIAGNAIHILYRRTYEQPVSSRPQQRPYRRTALPEHDPGLERPGSGRGQCTGQAVQLQCHQQWQRLHRAQQCRSL